MMEATKKPWCEYSGDTACNCKEGDCTAVRMRKIIDAANMLTGYGLTIEEAGEDIIANLDLSTNPHPLNTSR